MVDSKINGRGISRNFINALKNSSAATIDLSFVTNYAKEHKGEVFFGIRNNAISLYVCGGSFFNIIEKKQSFIAEFNGESYLKNDKKLKDQVDKINGKILNEGIIDEWNNILDELKEAVKKYMFSHPTGDGEKSSKEKILQQRLALAFNNQSAYPFFTYDIEYAIEALNDYYRLNPNISEDKYEPNASPHTLGRLDNMVIGIDEDKNITLYLMEIKQGVDAITAPNSESFGHGVIGHVNLYMSILKSINNDQPYISEYRKKKYGINYEIDIRNLVISEIKNIMNTYLELDLINNNYFKDNIKTFDDIKFKEAKLVFYLGGYNMSSKKFENHLGITGDDKYSVIKLLNNNPHKYKYTDYIEDFLFHKDTKEYSSTLPFEAVDLNIVSYNEVKCVTKNDMINLVSDEERK